MGILWVVVIVAVLLLLVVLYRHAEFLKPELPLEDMGTVVSIKREPKGRYRLQVQRHSTGEEVTVYSWTAVQPLQLIRIGWVKGSWERL